MIISNNQIILSGEKQALNDFSNILKKKKKIYYFSSKCTFSLFIDETSCRKNGIN